MLVRLLVAAILIASGAGGASAESAWRPFKALKLYVSDDVDPSAQVFTAKGHFLVVSSKADELFLLSPRDYTVHAVDRSALDGGEPTVDPETTDGLELVGVLQRQGATLKWESDDLRFALSHKPPLIGLVSLEDLRKQTDKYELDIRTYEPDPAAIKALGAVTEPTEIVVAFGIWCPVCAEWFPRFVKTMEQAANDKLSMTLISVNEGLNRPKDLLEANGIDGVPTFVVKQGGKEIGRIDPDWLEQTGEPVLEKRLVEIINGS